ncbi:Gfo/Idh/MocA family oxidoreductase [Brachybacterium sp. EF45031]|uniref:Gfo/Idh/MocA family protein n=1 Tax=Brachybacterium sillae TaxID=2810536 RepID=UPI00217E6E98|nr:Gfo/Idh/MocA family oxidoreductase [Brachybacterium sillae]MCS6712138.1 Gfo/Idh/MocA family oxidoreductase [Brachybacterium sillae]
MTCPTAVALPTTQVSDPHDAPALRWGIVAPGGIADHFVRCLHGATASRAVAVVSRAQERAEAFAAEHGIDRAYDSLTAMIADGEIDAVYVASPHAQHHELARPVLEAGVPTLVEKAFTLNTAQAQDLIGVARDRGVLLMEAMWTRFLPQTDVLRQVVEQGLLGELVLVRADHGQFFPHDPHHRLFAPELGDGALLDLGVYPVSFAQMLLGDLTDLQVAGDLTDQGVDATAAILARGRDGARAVLDTTLRARTATLAEVVGTEATARLSSPFYAPGTLTVTWHDGGEAAVEHPGNRDLCLAYEAAEFARCLQAGRTESPLMPWDDTLSVLRTLDAVRAEIGVVYPGEASA